MISSAKKRQFQYKKLDYKLPYQERALQLLESSERRSRMMGFALLTTCYHYCNQKTQDFIRKKWVQETNLKKIRKKFIEYCEEVFSQ
jgi:hypothetical protein